MSSKDGWIGVDLDGTLAVYHGWKDDGGVGEIIMPMKYRVLRWLAQGREVRIFTARTGPEQVAIVQRWLELNGLPRLAVTNVKDLAMVELWDDRAVQVEFNKGMPVRGTRSRVVDLS